MSLTRSGSRVGPVRRLGITTVVQVNRLPELLHPFFHDPGLFILQRPLFDQFIIIFDVDPVGCNPFI